MGAASDREKVYWCSGTANSTLAFLASGDSVESEIATMGMPRALALAGQAQRPPEAEVRVVVDRVALEHRLELGCRFGELAVAEIGPAERLADRGRVASAGHDDPVPDRDGGAVPCLDDGEPAAG